MVRLQLSCLLAVVTVVVVAVVPSTHGECAAVDPHCYCDIDRQGRNIIYCQSLGNATQVPVFTHSSTVYFMLVISDGTNGTTLATVQSSAFNEVKVKEIRLSSIGIVTIQSGAFSGIGDILERLSIYDNQLETISDDAFNGLKQLKELSLSRNRLKTVSAGWFSQLIALETLRLDNNKIETISDDAFNGLKQLKQLSLSMNRLKTVSAGWFSQLIALETLSLDNNQIETIPNDAFDGINQLTTLYLYGNHLKSVRTAWFNQFPALETLQLGANHLTTIPDDAFNRLNQLKTLSLWYNGLATVNATWFSQLTALENLDLSLNQFERIPDNAFDGLGQLKTLRLNHYRLKTLSYALVQNKSHLELLSLYGNPLECDCRLAWVRTKATILDKSHVARCASPPAVKGTSVVAYDISMCAAITTETASTTAGNPTQVDTTVASKTHVTTVDDGDLQATTTSKSVSEEHVVSTTAGNPTQVDTTVASKTQSVSEEHVGRIYYILTIALGSFSVAVVSGILIYVIRKQCVKCRKTVDDVDTYTHTRPEDIDLTTAVYDTIASTEPTCEKIREP